MFKKMLFVFILLLIQNVCLATMFFKQSIDKQVEEATSGVEVILTSTRVFKNSFGTIMTEYTFNVLESYNLSSDDLENQKLKLTLPGGSYQGITTVIDGAPNFNANERSFLLLKKIEATNYLSNFSMGKFKIQDVGGKPYYISEVFPSDPLVGKIAKEKMIELMKDKWKFSYYPMPGAIFKKNPETDDQKLKVARFTNVERRQPAQEKIPNEEVPIFFWVAILVVGIFFGLIFVKLGKSEHQHKH